MVYRWSFGFDLAQPARGTGHGVDVSAKPREVVVVAQTRLRVEFVSADDVEAGVVLATGEADVDALA